MINYIISIVPGIGIGILLVVGLRESRGNTYEAGYKAGQIDALTGKVKYHLVENPDKTKEWKKIKDRE